jgi:hypothetical protein
LLKNVYFNMPAAYSGATRGEAFAENFDLALVICLRFNEGENLFQRTLVLEVVGCFRGKRFDEV